LLANIQTVFNDNFENTNRIEYNDEIGSVVVSIWADGIANEYLLAYGGDIYYVASWKKMIENLIYLANSMNGYIEAAGFDEMHFVLNVLNDINKENSLLCIFDGVVVYNALD